MISIKQLSYALAVEKNLHFKKAAEQCHVSQSTLSAALRELESQLGLKIFERSNKSVLVTPVGKEVLRRARRIVLEAEDLQKLSDCQKPPLSFPISVGVIPTIAPYLLPRLLSVLNQDFPNAKIRFHEAQSAQLIERVVNGEIDTAILALPYPTEGLLSMEFWQEDFYWISTAGSEHSQQVEITSEEIHPEKLMLLNEGHCLKDHVLDVCKFSKSTQGHGVGATSLNTLVEMVRGGLGTTLIPAMAMQQLVENDRGLAAVHLNEPGPHRRLAFMLRPNYTRTSSVQALIKLCKVALETHH